ncbi:MAG: hypothetical protein LBU15_00175 [Rickettsiales bacterium]|nr:hypothetical protein [Rickettsiales bacterium]
MQLVCECSGALYDVNDNKKLDWAMKNLYCDANVQKIFKGKLLRDLLKAKVEPTVCYVVAHLLEPNPTLAKGIGRLLAEVKILAEVKSKEAKEHGAELPALVRAEGRQPPPDAKEEKKKAEEKLKEKKEAEEKLKEKKEAEEKLKEKKKAEEKLKEKKKAEEKLKEKKKAEDKEHGGHQKHGERQPSPVAKEEKKEAEDKEHGGHQKHGERLPPSINSENTPGKNSIIEVLRKNTRPSTEQQATPGIPGAGVPGVPKSRKTDRKEL